MIRLRSTTPEPFSLDLKIQLIRFSPKCPFPTDCFFLFYALASGAWPDRGRPGPKPGLKAEVSPATSQALAGLAKELKNRGSRGQAASPALPGRGRLGSKPGLKTLLNYVTGQTGRA